MSALFRRFAASEDASATIELGLGAVLVITVAALAFDLYSGIKARDMVGRAAVALAEYTAVDPAPARSEMQALTEVLNDQVIGMPSDLAITVSLIRKGTTPDAPVSVVWSDGSFQSGDGAANISQTCPQVANQDRTVTLPAAVTDNMRQGAAAVVSEACAKLRREGSVTGQFLEQIYRLHVVPARVPAQLPQAPA